MSITTVRTALASLMVAHVAGVKTALAQLPRKEIIDADLPLALIRAKGATYPDNPEDMYLERRAYTVTLMVLPVPQGLDNGEGEARTEPFVPLVRDMLKGSPSLEIGRALQSARLTADSGPSQLVWAGVTYWGCEFSLTVEEFVPRIFLDSE
jgi:hypothetical protein